MKRSEKQGDIASRKLGRGAHDNLSASREEVEEGRVCSVRDGDGF